MEILLTQLICLSLFSHRTYIAYSCYIIFRKQIINLIWRFTNKIIVYYFTLSLYLIFKKNPITIQNTCLSIDLNICEITALSNLSMTYF